MNNMLVVMSIIGLLISPTHTFAGSQDECAIWLCAPQGFPSPGCKGARKALKKRLFKGKSPLPQLQSCISSGVGGGSNSSSKITASHSFVSGKNGVWRPTKLCIKKFRRLGACYHAISIFSDGEQQGDTFYFNEYEKE